MSRLRQSRATLTRDKGSRVKVASVTGHITRCVMARRTVAQPVFGIGLERCSILCDFDESQSRALKTRDKIAGVTSVLGTRTTGMEIVILSPQCSYSLL